MNFNQVQSPKRKTSGKQPKNPLTEKNAKRTYKIASAILAVFVLHFAWQLSFVQRENLRATEDSLNNARLDVLPVESQPIEKPVDTNFDSITKKTEVENTAKSVMPVKYSVPENAHRQPEIKKKSQRESRSERLRRAEKLLTGF